METEVMVNTMPTCPTLAPCSVRYNGISKGAIDPAMFARTMANINQRMIGESKGVFFSRVSIINFFRMHEHPIVYYKEST